MDERTQEALEASIARWKDNLARAKRGASLLDGSNDCPLCRLFHPDMQARAYKDDCAGCPVMARTGRPFCRGTPYHQAVDAISTREKCTAAQAEIEFLESLRPPV